MTEEDFEFVEKTMFKLEGLNLINIFNEDGERSYKLSKKGVKWIEGDFTPKLKDFKEVGLAEVPVNALLYIYRNQKPEGEIDERWLKMENGEVS